MGETDHIWGGEPEAGCQQSGESAGQAGTERVQQDTGRRPDEQREDPEPEQDVVQGSRVVVGRDDVARVVEPVTIRVRGCPWQQRIGQHHGQHTGEYMVEQAVLWVHAEVVVLDGDQAGSQVNGFVDGGRISGCLHEADDHEAARQQRHRHPRRPSGEDRPRRGSHAAATVTWRTSCRWFSFDGRPVIVANAAGDKPKTQTRWSPECSKAS